MIDHKVVAMDEWTTARIELLRKEKELTRLRDELARQRRALPWVRVEKRYVFDAADGKKSFADLFADRSQLAVYHFMLAPGSDHLCGGCSFLCDHVDAARMHFEQDDLSFVAISRAPMSRILAVKARMGWGFNWVSSFANDFNFDYNVSFTDESIARGDTYYNYQKRENPTVGEAPGISMFKMAENGEVFHTYSTYARGGDPLIGAYNWLDLAPKGRNEKSVMDWVRLHDEYGQPDHGS